MTELENRDENEQKQTSSPTTFSRRDIAKSGLSLGSLMLVTGLLDACKQRGFNSKVKDTGAANGFLAKWKGLEAAGLEPRGLAFQRELLTLQSLKGAPQPMFAELRAAGYKTLYCGKVDANMPPLKTNGLAMILDYEGVMKALADVSTFTVIKNKKEMAFATGRFVLCDTGEDNVRGGEIASSSSAVPTADGLKRHDIEKSILHTAVRADDTRLDDLLSKSVKPGDVSIVKNVVAKHADTLGAALKGKTEIDVVQDVARWLPIRIVTDYFGVPSGDRAIKATLTTDEQTALYGPGKGSNIMAPTEAEMYQWIADSFQNLFLNLTDDAATRKKGRRASQLLSCYVGKVVGARSSAINAATDVKNTMVDRMVWMRKDNAGKGNDIDKMFSEVIQSPSSGSGYKTDPATGKYLRDASGNKILEGGTEQCYNDWQAAAYDPYDMSGWGMNCVVAANDRRITANIIGAVAGAAVTTEEVIGNVFDVLTDPANTAALAYAKAAAASADYFPKLHSLYKECMRFRPQAEVVVRMVTQDVTLPSVGSETVTLKQGTLVLVAITSAMRDASAIENPDSIVTYDDIQAKPGLRKPEHYLDMGWGRHMCLGKYIAPVQVVEAMRVILNLGDLERVDPAGLVHSDDKGKGDGPYAQSLKLRVK